MPHDYDLLVIGAGSGGLAHAQRAAEYGAKVAIIENGPLGGTCVNVGCVPKKVMWYAAHHAESMHRAGDYGFDVAARGHDWRTLKERRDAYIERLNNIYGGNLERRGIVLKRGTARFRDSHTVEVDGEPLRAGRIAIATGGLPKVPAIPGAELGFTSDGFFELEKRPRRVLVIGSGYIAVELAGIFNGLGSEVTVAVRKNAILRDFDEELGARAMEIMAADGVRFETGFVPVTATRTDKGITVDAADGRRSGPVDGLLWAIGREPETRALDLGKAGVETDAEGYVPVDEFQKTNVDHIFALGDVTGRVPLTPVAIAAGRRLADRLYGGMEGRHLDYHLVPTVVFTHPPIGTVGPTEAEARAEHGDAVNVYRSHFNPMLYALSERKVASTMKIVTVGADEKVIACHMIGDGVDEILQGFAVAIRMGATKKDLDDTVAIHPTSAEELVTMR